MKIGSPLALAGLDRLSVQAPTGAELQGAPGHSPPVRGLELPALRRSPSRRTGRALRQLWSGASAMCRLRIPDPGKQHAGGRDGRAEGRDARSHPWEWSCRSGCSFLPWESPSRGSGCSFLPWEWPCRGRDARSHPWEWSRRGGGCIPTPGNRRPGSGCRSTPGDDGGVCVPPLEWPCRGSGCSFLPLGMVVPKVGMLVPTPGNGHAEDRDAHSYPWEWSCRGSGKTPGCRGLKKGARLGVSPLVRKESEESGPVGLIISP